MAEYRVDFRDHRPHGVFDRALEPVLTIEPGDSVDFRTLDASWGHLARDLGVDLPYCDIEPEARQGHALCGPVAVRGAQPGMVLEIEIDEIRPARWGWTWAGKRPEPQKFDLGLERDVLLTWDIDAERGRARDRNELGIIMMLRPFMGVMGNAPAVPGPLPTAPPRNVGGNLDCRELQSGSILYLPIEVDGALFSVGDGHAAQGDGEVSSTAIECSMDSVQLTFDLRDDFQLRGPEALTAAGYITIGLGETLDEATLMAIEGMIAYMDRTYDLSRPEAVAVASIAVQLRVTQIVNGVVGVHAVLPSHAFMKQ